MAPTPAHRTAEVESTKTTIDRVKRSLTSSQNASLATPLTVQHQCWPGWWRKGIEPYVPVWDKAERKNYSFSSNDFHWNEETVEYRCPAGNALRSEWRAFKNERSHVTKANTFIFRSRQTDCFACPMKAKCCPNTTFRKIARSVHEAARDVAGRIGATPAKVPSRHERKKVKILFAHLNHSLIRALQLISSQLLIFDAVLHFSLLKLEYPDRYPSMSTAPSVSICFTNSSRT
jgi:hypothetical protein